jgi:hypothetical protein
MLPVHFIRTVSQWNCPPGSLQRILLPMTLPKKKFGRMPVSVPDNSKYSRHFPQNRFKFDGLTTVPLNFLPLPCLFVKSLYL